MCLPFWRYPFPPVHAGWPWMTNVRSWGIPGINCPARLSPAFPHHKTPNFPQLSQLEVHTFKKLSWYHHVIGNHQKNEVFFATKTLWWDYDCSRDPAESKYHFPIRCAASVATSVQAFQVQKKSMAKTRSKDPQKKAIETDLHHPLPEHVSKKRIPATTAMMLQYTILNTKSGMTYGMFTGSWSYLRLKEHFSCERTSTSFGLTIKETSL